MKKILYIFSFSSLWLAEFAQAQGLIPPQKPTGLPGGANDTISQTLGDWINLALVFIGILCVAFIIIGGFRYITSAGNDEAAESGKKTLTNAVIGLVIVILSYVIVTVIINAVARDRV